MNLLSPDFFFFFFFFFFNDTATTEIYTLSLHDALPIYRAVIVLFCLALLVALMQGASWFSQNHQRQRNPQLEELAQIGRAHV